MPAIPRAQGRRPNIDKMGHPTVSAVIITRNEEDHITACLEHLQWCDERIVVDMHSTDRTRERAEGLATKILLHDPIPYFDAARNQGIEAAAGEWILVVDADEIIPPQLAEFLRGHVATTVDVAGIWIPRMNYCFGLQLPHIGDFPNYQLRCFRRGTGLYPADRIHCAPQIHGGTAYLPIREGAWIIHSRRNQTIADLVRKWDEYAEKEAGTRLKSGPVSRGPLDMLWAPLSAFRFRFFTKRGYRDGTAGLVLSMLFAFYRFEVEAKLWEAGGYGGQWDRDVGRLRSFPRTVWSLATHLGRRIWLRRRSRRDGQNAT